MIQLMTYMRTWHGEVPIEKADAYEKFMAERAAPDYGSVEGLLQTLFQRRDEDGVAHFLLVTLWDSMKSMKRFAGEQPEIAKYYPEDDDFLLRKEQHSTIYRTFYKA